MMNDMTDEKLRDRIRGSIVGGAVGDALGYAVEFVGSFAEIRNRYGERGITEFDMECCEARGGAPRDKALFSDDTQMTLYTAEGLLEAAAGGEPIIPMIRGAYLAWVEPQIGMKIKVPYESELLRIEELNQRRAPGTTCLDSLMAISMGKEPSNNSKGCGGVMRVAPIGIFGATHSWSLETTARTAGECALLTHLHPLSTYSSAALAVIVQMCLMTDCADLDSFTAIVGSTVEVVESVYGQDAKAMKEFREIIANAIALRESPLADWEVIERELGGGWVAEETLAIAIFSVARHLDDTDAVLICAVNHGGDSDSTGAVAGNIIGAINGLTSIPDKYTSSIQLKELLLTTADALG